MQGGDATQSSQNKEDCILCGAANPCENGCTATKSGWAINDPAALHALYATGTTHIFVSYGYGDRLSQLIKKVNPSAEQFNFSGFSFSVVVKKMFPARR